MSDEFEFRNYNTIEEFGKTIEGSKYFHDLYLKAVNHPIRRKILEIINKQNKISYRVLVKKLIEMKIIKDDYSVDYNINFLVKALCLNIVNENGEILYQITQGGKVIEYL
ncbi:MAG: hypothetical protein ACFFAS_17540 [Promethearchaeota archaeon]